MSKNQDATSLPPRLHITADDDEFDDLFLQHLREEGFDVTYLPYDDKNIKNYVNELKHLADDLELGESYAIIAFGNAATTNLDFHAKPQPKLAALICYYPTQIPNPKTKFPPHLHVCVHLASSQNFAPAFEKCYAYQNVLVGFAESDLETYNKVAASLAWTRTLSTLRKAFKSEKDLEPLKEAYATQLYGRRDAKGVLETMVEPTRINEPYMNCVPTMSGGIGQKELYIFYRDYFIPQNPPSLNIKLVSRTVGIDRVVDEMIISFKHTQVVSWILPNVQPTNKVVHIAIVSIVKMRGGKLVHEHLYWDQASVLVQVALLDPKLVPEAFKKQGLKQLPVYGKEEASKILDEESQPSNGLLADWKQSGGQAAAGGGNAKLPQRPKQAAGGGNAS